ncbi:MAG: x-prolyl-dipeptidyl aminopeptidase() [uncultured Gemmatimonadetes bacterium]|uniref:Xaa-Pro dipeptidyl-peptidase n=1 Tax=uncultured Gemmatimonadota bacterium TaxID=203437 RepID=A0A6J4KZ49_9BACT|nr:MAG: x-prolyl-dipeptidyl aminopeptidase() [uncultured Gemmatimonadota bacterium]
MTKSLSRRACAALALTLACAASLHAQARPVFVNGMAQTVPAFADSSRWIRQNLWVETDFDSDRDGRNDRVHVAVTRPRQTETEGLKVPVVYGSSPYYAGVARTFAFWDVRQELGEPSPPRGTMLGPRHDPTRTRISNDLVGTWVPRGFAVVHSEAPGTGRSQGCATVGDTPERTAMRFVVDWLNGRARGYTTPDGAEQVSATSWSTGKVGMIGTSYEGTLPLAAAMTGVAGLEVVIPVSANTSYYHYYRSNGLVRSPGGYLGEDVDVLYDFIASGPPATRAVCDRIWKSGVFAAGLDRATGDYNEFWASRELLPHVGKIRAAVLLAHGLNDFNVMPSHSVRIYEAMKARGLPVSLYLHQGGHGGDPPFELVNRWFTHYLYGVENGVRNDPPVWIVSSTAAARVRTPGRRAVMPAPVPSASFPAPGSAHVRLHPTQGGNGIAPLALRASRGTGSILDNPAVTGSANAAAPTSAHRLLFATAPLRDSLRISGTPRVTLRVAADRRAANLSVWLVTLPYDSTRIGDASRAGLVTLGWADIQNHASLARGGVYESNLRGEPLVPGRFYDLTFDLEPDDQIIPAGKRLGIMIMSSDPEFTLSPRAGTRLTVDLAGTSFSLPVVGGSGALIQAGAF